ncbi:hypothetical protein HWV62_6193 [Athelia sp. TMB]|nr:hypothetical protein HWV62_6193 [Athelia sp. TMB]
MSAFVTSDWTNSKAERISGVLDVLLMVFAIGAWGIYAQLVGKSEPVRKPADRRARRKKISENFTVVLRVSTYPSRPPQMLISGCLCSLWIYHESPAPVYKPVGMLCAVWGIIQLVATILTMSTAIPDRWAEWWVRLLLVGSAVEEVLIAISCLLVAELTREMSPKSSRALYTFCAFISETYINQPFLVVRLDRVAFMMSHLVFQKVVLIPMMDRSTVESLNLAPLPDAAEPPAAPRRSTESSIKFVDRRSLATIRLEPIAHSPSVPTIVRALSPPPPGIYVAEQQEHSATSAVSPTEVDTTPRSSMSTVRNVPASDAACFEHFKDLFTTKEDLDARGLPAGSAADANAPLDNSKLSLNEATGIRRYASIVSDTFFVVMVRAEQCFITANSDQNTVQQAAFSKELLSFLCHLLSHVRSSFSFSFTPCLPVLLSLLFSL